jgi:hypothetical protein
MRPQKPGEVFSEAVVKFRNTRQNPYNLDREALGKLKDPLICRAAAQ